MGVPALFRWLSRKYPKIISPVVEEDAEEEIGAAQYSDANPNGELDNLYLDMNGIVHPCSHPENKPAPETEDEMFLDVFKYTDRVLMMARPRKVLMIAVDGVAPRAKMNQQRARRFRSSQDAKIAQEEKERQILELENRGESIDEAIKGKKSWDSNAITPGTPFMDRLALALRYWTAYKLANDPGWADLQVIISDATVPGEGEHKLMSFIRSQRSDPEYDPNTKHCIYGLDADLIFLGLATHEPHFRVLREDVFANQSRQMRVSDRLQMTQEQKDAMKESQGKTPFLWLHINVLREYLEAELYNPRLPFTFDLERAIDDWVFICFFVGNDFLPHLPSLDVRDNGIDILVGCWKRILPNLKGYITCDGNLNVESVEKLMSAMSYKENEIFRKRHENEKRWEENDKRRKIAQEEDKALKNQYLSTVSKGKDKAPIAADTNMPLMTTSGEIVEGFANFSNKDIVNNRATITKANMSNNEAAAALKKVLDAKRDTSVSAVSAVKESSQEIENNPKKRTREEEEVANNDDFEPPTPDENGDSVRLWESGYKERYYQSKFHVKTGEEIDEVRKGLVKSYLEGISWVLLYYYQGCPSWQWYYPYHYAPFAVDFVNLKDIVGEGIKFDLGKPFQPYEQLMSVLPAASGHNLPEVFRDLMSNPESEIIDFYPEDFEIDMNGKKMSWQGIALLPFIDEKRLLDAVQKKYVLLTEEERERNSLRKESLLISSKNKNYEKFTTNVYDEGKEIVHFRSSATNLAGSVSKNERFKINSVTYFPLVEGSMPDIDNKEYLEVVYSMPQKVRGKSMLLNGYISHTKVLTQEDKDALIYGQQRNGHRFRSPTDNSGYVNNGPSGVEPLLQYSMRRGGYRSFIEYFKNRGSYHNNAPGRYVSQSGAGFNQSPGNEVYGQNSHYGRQGDFNNGFYQGHNQMNNYGKGSGYGANHSRGRGGYNNNNFHNYGNNFGNNYGNNHSSNYGNNYGNHNNYGNNYNDNHSRNSGFSNNRGNSYQRPNNYNNQAKAEASNANVYNGGSTNQQDMPGTSGFPSNTMQNERRGQYFDQGRSAKSNNANNYGGRNSYRR